jgi:hypothetical protein
MDIYNGTGKEVVIYDITTCELKDFKLCVTDDSKEIIRIQADKKLLVCKEIDTQRTLYGIIPYAREIFTNSMLVPDKEIVIVNEDYFLFLHSIDYVKKNIYLLGLPVYDKDGKEIIGYQSLVERRF